MSTSGYRLGLMHGALLVAAVLVIFVAFANAQTWLVASGIAIHFDGRTHCNNLTTGVGIESDVYSAGVYRNSNCKWSAYAAQAWLPLRSAYWSLGVIGGAVTGYDHPIVPVGGLVASWEGERIGMNLIYIPPFQGSGNVAWLTWKTRW